MSLLCRMSGETILTDSGPPKLGGRLDRFVGAGQPRRNDRDAGVAEQGAGLLLGPRPLRGGLAAGTGTAAGGARCCADRVASDHRATLRSAITAWRRPGITYGTPPCSIEARVKPVTGCMTWLM